MVAGTLRNPLEVCRMKISELKKLYAKKDKMHNYNHILRIKRRVNILKIDYPKTDKNLLNFIINYHGLKDYVIKNKSKFNKEYIKSLLRHNQKPKKIEERLVHDANALDNIGKFGIKKTIEVGKSLGRSRENSIKYYKNEIKKIKFYTKKGKQIAKHKSKELSQ